MLWLCLQIAKGENLWNFKTHKGTTLYLCLEDSYQRIQSRIAQITDEAPENTHFATMSGVIGEGLEEQIEGFIAEHPDTILIVIDTLQKIRCDTNSSYDCVKDNEEYRQRYENLFLKLRTKAVK